MNQDHYQAPELSRPLSVDKIPAGGVVEHIVARPEERKALAARFGLLDLPSFEADLNADFIRAGSIVSVTGTIRADVIQSCVVSLEPISSHLEEKINFLFAKPDLSQPQAEGGLLGDVEDEDLPELIENGQIDLGEVAAQQLALSLNPYPRMPEATIPASARDENKALCAALAKITSLREKPKTDQ